MWSNSCTSSVFFLFTLVLSILHLSTSDTLITDICKHVSRHVVPQVPYDFCTRSLLAAPGSRGATLEGLGLIALNLTNNNLKDTANYIQELLDQKYLDACVRSILELCSDSYYHSINQYIPDATSIYKMKGFKGAGLQLGAVQDEAENCEGQFHGFKGFVLPLTLRNNAAYGLATIAVHITNLLQNGTHYDRISPRPSAG